MCVPLKRGDIVKNKLDIEMVFKAVVLFLIIGGIAGFVVAVATSDLPLWAKFWPLK